MTTFELPKITLDIHNVSKLTQPDVIMHHIMNNDITSVEISRILHALKNLNNECVQLDKVLRKQLKIAKNHIRHDLDKLLSKSLTEDERIALQAPKTPEQINDEATQLEHIVLHHTILEIQDELRHEPKEPSIDTPEGQQAYLDKLKGK